MDTKAETKNATPQPVNLPALTESELPPSLVDAKPDLKSAQEKEDDARNYCIMKWSKFIRVEDRLYLRGVPLAELQANTAYFKNTKPLRSDKQMQHFELYRLDCAICHKKEWLGYRLVDRRVHYGPKSPSCYTFYRPSFFPTASTLDDRLCGPCANRCGCTQMNATVDGSVHPTGLVRKDKQKPCNICDEMRCVQHQFNTTGINICLLCRNSTVNGRVLQK